METYIGNIFVWKHDSSVETWIRYWKDIKARYLQFGNIYRKIIGIQKAGLHEYWKHTLETSSFGSQTKIKFPNGMFLIYREPCFLNTNNFSLYASKLKICFQCTDNVSNIIFVFSISKLCFQYPMYVSYIHFFFQIKRKLFQFMFPIYMEPWKPYLYRLPVGQFTPKDTDLRPARPNTNWPKLTF